MQSLQVQNSHVSIGSLRNSQQVIFLMHGITAVMGWFVVLNSLDYFHSIYNRFDVYAYFLLAVLFGYLITAAAYRKLTSLFSIQRIVNIGLLTCTGSLIALLSASVLFHKAQGFGFALSIIICMILGISSNAVQLSYFAMINFTPTKVISRFTIGTALSGLLLTILRMLITAVAGIAPHVLPICLYFSLACGCHISDLLLNNHFCKSQYFRDTLLPHLERKKTKIPLQGEQTGESQIIEVEKSYVKQLVVMNRKMFPYPIIIFMNYLSTMMLFPDLTIKIEFGFSRVWSSLLFILCFGLGDVVGKLTVQIKGAFNSRSNIYLICSKAIFYLLIPVLASGRVHDDPLVSNSVFPFFVVFLLGFTTGFTLASSIFLTFQRCKPSDKELSGVLSGISLQLGLTVGTILAVPMQLIAKQ